MSPWVCGIGGCAHRTDAAAGLIRHQASDHPQTECAVCGETVPAGFFAIRHVVREHKRAEYVRAYDANSDDIRVREQLVEDIESAMDVTALLAGLENDDEVAVSAGD